MVTISFTTKDTNATTRIANAFKETFRIPIKEDKTPLFTDVEWVRKKIMDYVKSVVKTYEGRVAEKAILVDIENILS